MVLFDGLVRDGSEFFFFVALLLMAMCQSHLTKSAGRISLSTNNVADDLVVQGVDGADEQSDLQVAAGEMHYHSEEEIALEEDGQQQEEVEQDEEEEEEVLEEEEVVPEVEEEEEDHEEENVSGEEGEADENDNTVVVDGMYGSMLFIEACHLTTFHSPVNAIPLMKSVFHAAAGNVQHELVKKDVDCIVGTVHVDGMCNHNMWHCFFPTPLILLPPPPPLEQGSLRSFHFLCCIMQTLFNDIGNSVSYLTRSVSFVLKTLQCGYQVNIGAS
jgi:hypothetical protein